MTCCARVAVLALLFGCGLVSGGCGEPTTVETTVGPSSLPRAGGVPSPPNPQPLPAAPGTPFAQLAAAYQVTFVAENCQDGFPGAYRTRTYASRVEQRGSDVTVVLTGVPSISWFPELPRLWGAIGSDRLTLTSYQGNDQWFGLFEQMSPTHLVSILVDDMALTGSSEKLSGGFAGAFLLYEGSAAGWPRIAARCSSTSHGVTLTR